MMSYELRLVMGLGRDRLRPERASAGIFPKDVHRSIVCIGV